MKRPILILILLLAIAVGATILYFGISGGVSDGRRTAQSGAPSGPSGEMMHAMHRMHETANKVEMTGDIDKDFAALMVPHHQSAVEMARVYLRHGRDPELRRLSQNIVASQEAEIRQMRGRGPAPAAGAKDPHSGH